ncbi:bifunctional DNA primase/polymerase [Peterkaempfera bronchialis]|uniref:DNA primase n=1 Tax=Peterkaempfera bronchialis TaxID=2126346 RepID=A0A345T0V3_9ACTN|nr:bifunctional DNA primase/polymerase [Peterkaempfera bronchialis]AXI79608.1 DNA primase [Peterkaempfera bronchialis]
MDIQFGDLRFGSRRRTRATALQAAAEYAGRWGWWVAAGKPPGRTRGTAASDADPGGRCGCGVRRCAAPGLHPAPGEAAPVAGPWAERCEVRALWEAAPEASVLLPTGRTFDVLDIPAQAGCQALVRLERMGTRLGPVLASPAGRALFFVAPGAARALPDLLYRMGWDDAALDLACHGEGRYVAAPPTALAGLGPAHWLRPPTPESACRPPEARLLLGTLAYACHRSREPVGADAGWLAS